MEIRIDMLIVGLFFLIVGALGTWATWFNPSLQVNSILIIIPSFGSIALLIASIFPLMNLKPKNRD